MFKKKPKHDNRITVIINGETLKIYLFFKLGNFLLTLNCFDDNKKITT